MRVLQSLEPLLDKWRSFGFAATEVDGHDVGALRNVLMSLPLKVGKPNAVICHTIKGKGISFAENNPDWHHQAKIRPEQITRMIAAGDKIISKENNGFAIGKAILMHSSATANRVLFVATGVMTTNALEAAELLAAKGIDCAVLHFHTIKPLDVTALLAYAAGVNAIITVTVALNLCVILNIWRR